jgi:hypothetical protein
MNDTLTLYEIEDGLRAAVEAYEEAREQLELVGNESPEVVNAAYERMRHAEMAVKGYLAEEVRKVNGIYGYIRHCDAMHALCDEEINRLVARAKTWERRRDWLKALTLQVMQQFDAKKFETATAVIRRQANGGVVAPVIVDPAMIPPEYVKLTVQLPESQWKSLCGLTCVEGANIKREFMLGAIGAALARGEIVPGAKPGERGEHLRVA